MRTEFFAQQGGDVVRAAAAADQQTALFEEIYRFTERGARYVQFLRQIALRQETVAGPQRAFQNQRFQMTGNRFSQLGRPDTIVQHMFSSCLSGQSCDPMRSALIDEPRRLTCYHLNQIG